VQLYFYLNLLSTSSLLLSFAPVSPLIFRPPLTPSLTSRSSHFCSCFVICSSFIVFVRQEQHSCASQDQEQTARNTLHTHLNRTKGRKHRYISLLPSLASLPTGVRCCQEGTRTIDLCVSLLHQCQEKL